MKKLAIIDTFALLHRAYHAIPYLTTKDGLMVNAAYGFSAILLRLISELKPDYIIAAFDLPDETFRHKEYKAYKAQREAPEKDFIDQISIVEEILAALNIPTLAVKGYEADDVIGSVARHCNTTEPDLDVVIVSGDLDTLQLINANTSVYTMRQGINDTLTYDERAVRERYGLTPRQIIDLKALKGDASDNIPGVKGIGEKGAINLLREFGNIETLYENLDSPTIKARTKSLLIDQKTMAFQSKKLATIVTDLPVRLDLAKAHISNYDTAKVTSLFQRLEFKSLIAKLPTPHAPSHDKQPASDKKTSYTIIETARDMAAWAERLSKKKTLACDTETTGLNTLTAHILGASFAWGPDEALFVHTRTPEQRAAFVRSFGPLYENPRIAKIGHNIKYDYQVLSRIGITIRGIACDTMLAAYLLHPERSLKLEDLVFAYIGHTMEKLSDLPTASPRPDVKKKNIDVESIDQERLARYGAADADYCLRLYRILNGEIAKENLTSLLESIEVPLVPILAMMEHDGILLDIPYLATMEKKLRVQAVRLEKKIFSMAGQPFNIASPLQLKEILFEKLALATTGIKRKKTGLSTAADELEKIKTAHPIIELILEYRELTKLISTYVATLPNQIDRKDKRIHTSFNQTVTATGRLSSHNPNLQNIPVRTELGRAIRKAFVAPKGKALISADYSQIELRLAAIMSEDPVMLGSFARGEDIHRATAAAINDVSLTDVTPEQRRAAKEINFGVIYGLGSTGLAQRTGLTRIEAKLFIEAYFKLYQGLKRYLDDTKSFAHANGYVQTFFGRKRRLPEIYASSPMLVAQAERMAINMPLQGTAADIIKRAMIACNDRISAGSLPARMLLQVHDELVFEADIQHATVAAHAIREAMEGAGSFAIPLTVDVKAGPHWAEMESLDTKSL